MNYKYGVIPTSQIKQQKEYLQKAIFQTLCLKEENYQYLDGRFNSLLQQLDGFNHLFQYQPVVITIMSLLESARYEEDFAQYRKAILDATALVNQIKDGDADV